MVSWDIVNRALYLMLWVFEVLAIVGLILALTLPIQAYAFREFFQWKHHPSPDTYEAYLEKQRQERTVRLILAACAWRIVIFPARRHLTMFHALFCFNSRLSASNWMLLILKGPRVR